MSVPQSQIPQPEPGYTIGVALIAFLVVPQVLAIAGIVNPEQCGRGDIMTGIYFLGVGAMFLASYYWSHKTFVLRGFMWVCENFSHPTGRRMAFFYFSLCVGVACLSFFAGFGLIEHRYSC